MKLTEGGSITTQRELLHDYIKNQKEFNGYKVIEKCDDGFSGTHFENKPQFMKMIELAKKGKIDCIIVKDFLRFGRDYVELGNYLEQLFPFIGMWFISVNDNYDSAELVEVTTESMAIIAEKCQGNRGLHDRTRAVQFQLRLVRLQEIKGR